MITLAKQFLLLIVLLNLLPAGLGNNTEETLIVRWNRAGTDAIFSLDPNLLFDRWSPTVTSRIMWLLHTAIYNAWAAYDSQALPAECASFSRQPESERTDTNKRIAISYAAYEILTTLLPSQQCIFDELMHDLGYDTDDISSFAASGVGTQTAIDLLEARENDGSNQLGDLNPSGVPYSEPVLLEGYKPYKYVNTLKKLRDINKWQPVRNPDGTPQEFLTPQWGQVDPATLRSGSQFRPEGPLTTADYPEFLAQAQEVYNISKSLTRKQKAIAYVWDPDVNYWNNFTRCVSVRDNNDLDQDVQLFFIVTTALFDAGIACWNTKRYYNSVRPITEIRNLIDPKWKPLLSTPPFPEYISGHSTYSGAAAEALRLFTGSDCYEGSITEPRTGVTISWDTFSELVAQIGMSRVYGGVHFMRGNLDGQSTGRKVGRYVWNKLQDLIQGRS